MRSRGLFETMRGYNGCVFAKKEHLNRLISGCSVLGIKPPRKSVLSRAIDDAMAVKKIKDARIRLVVLKSGEKTEFSASVEKIKQNNKIQNGFSVVLEKSKKRSNAPMPSVKSLDRDFYEKLFEKAKKNGYDEALFLNVSGELAEGTRTNVFLVKNNKVITPRLESGCLCGITRNKVLEICRSNRVNFIQRRVLAQELFVADEIFLTNAIIGVAPVVFFDKNSVGSGEPGIVTKKIIKAYNKEVENACSLR